MRIGKKPSRSRNWTKAGSNGKPKHISPEVVIGQLSSDLISTIYAPMIQELAGDVLERYADEVMKYEDSVKELQSQQDTPQNSDDDEIVDEEVEMDVDGSIPDDNKIDYSSLGLDPPKPPLFHSQFSIDEMETTVFKEASDYFLSKEGGWKTQANSAKFERLMDEKYGIFRPFIKEHPYIEDAIRSIQRKYVSGYFSPFRQKDPPIPKSTAVILLFMMQRGKMRWEILLLTGLFLLVGLQPWALVLIVGIVQILLSRRKHLAVGTMKTSIPAVDSYYEGAETEKEKYQKVLEPVGTPIDAKIVGEDFDTIIVGSGPAALYTGALLARAGRKVLVLSSNKDASGCVTVEEAGKNLPNEYKNIPFDIQSSNISKLSQHVNFLAPALSTSTDLQGGVRFVQVGSDADNHAFEILEIPGMGANGSSYTTALTAGNFKEALMDEAATCLGDGWPNADGTAGNSAIGAYIAACEQINATSNLFYASKIIPDTVNNARNKNTYGECATRYAAGLLNASFPLNAQTRSLVAAIGMRTENIRPNNTSLAAHITNLCSATSGQGMHYPVGGPRALCHALANVIERTGGKVVTGAPVSELVFDESTDARPSNTAVLDEGESASGQEAKDNSTPCPRCVGVQLFDGRKIKFSRIEKGSEPNLPAVISTTGLIDTFIRLLPDDLRVKHKVPRGLPALSESRPLMKALFLLDGTAKDLQLTGADYYRLPNAAKAIDELNPQTGEVKYGDIGWTDESMEAGESSSEGNDETKTDEDGGAVQPTAGDKKRRKQNFKFETGRSWINISFPSAKDPSFEQVHGKITTCVVSFQADDEFVQCFETKPKLYIPKQSSAYKSNAERLLQRVKRDLFHLYPQLEDKVLHAEIPNGLVRSLMHNPERYAAKGVRADTPYPGLYIGGSDLTVSGSFSASIVGGWLAANAVAGYSYIDLLFLQKNITSDIGQFLEVPYAVDEADADLAVPFLSRQTDEGDEEGENETKKDQ